MTNCRPTTTWTKTTLSNHPHKHTMSLFFKHPVTVLQAAGAAVTLGAIYLGTVAGRTEEA